MSRPFKMDPRKRRYSILACEMPPRRLTTVPEVRTPSPSPQPTPQPSAQPSPEPSPVASPVPAPAPVNDVAKTPSPSTQKLPVPYALREQNPGRFRYWQEEIANVVAKKRRHQVSLPPKPNKRESNLQVDNEQPQPSTSQTSARKSRASVRKTVAKQDN